MDRRAVLAALAAAAGACGGGSAAAAVTASFPSAPAPAPASAPMPNDIACWGDSLTPGIAATLQTLYPARAVFDGGGSSQSSTEIAARQGAVIPLLTVQGDTIPAAGGVQITAQTVALQNNQGPGPISGILGGVAGTVSFDDVSVFTFTRTKPGAAVALPPRSPFIVDAFERRSWVTTFWYGRNNFLAPDVVKADIAASVAFLAPGNNRFVVLSLLNGDLPLEKIGLARYKIIQRLNADLAAVYPRNYLDVRSWLVSNYDLSQQQDVIDHANDVVPTSLRGDQIHLNADGALVVAQKVRDFLVAKGW